MKAMSSLLLESTGRTETWNDALYDIRRGRVPPKEYTRRIEASKGVWTWRSALPLMPLTF